MLQDLSGVELRFRTGQEDPYPVPFQIFQQLLYPRVELVLKDPLPGKIFPVPSDRLPGLLRRKPVKRGKRLHQRRSDKRVQRGAVFDFDAEKGQRIGDRTGNSFPGVGQGTVQVEEAVGVSRHGVLRFFSLLKQVGKRSGE